MTLVDPVAFDIDEPVLPVRAPPKELHLGGDSADPVAPEAWLARIADEATGLLGALGEQRWSDPMRARGETERRIAAVRAALATCGVAAPLAAAENARRGRQDGRPWAFWPAGLADDGDVAA